ncbi:MAG: hypothetical protein K2P94_11620 [Rhodospirillaceae bacterium]|nr:hypothetical protein [Rhodospirillaceae bacterium]
MANGPGWNLLIVFLAMAAPAQGAEPAPAILDQQAMRALACKAADQIIQDPLQQTLGRGGFLYECDALPSGNVFIVTGRLQVGGSGGPTQAQYYGRIKPALDGRLANWTFCTLTINGLEAKVPGC